MSDLYQCQRERMLWALSMAGKHGLDSDEIRRIGVGAPTNRICELDDYYWIERVPIKGENKDNYILHRPWTLEEKAKQREERLAADRRLVETALSVREWSTLGGKFGRIVTAGEHTAFVTKKEVAYLIK